MKRRLLTAAAGILAAGLAAGTASAQAPASLPDYLANISGNTASTPSDVSTRDLLQLDIGMFTLYDRASNIYRRNILAKHPIILAMFSNQGGNLMLFRPGQAPITAPQVPKVYQILKSVGHSTMAISQVVIPSVNNANDKRWIAPMAAYRTQMKTALDGLDASNDIQADWKPAVKEILATNVAYMDDCLAKGVVTLEPLLAFAKKQAPNIKLIINWAASTQVKHWMGVMDEWSAMLGPDMAKTYAASNTIYVARQNNVLVLGARPVFRRRGDQRPADADRDDGLHHHGRGHAGRDDPHHRRPLGRRAVLRQLQDHGLRADGRRRPQDHHLRDAAPR